MIVRFVTRRLKAIEQPSHLGLFHHNTRLLPCVPLPLPVFPLWLRTQAGTALLQASRNLAALFAAILQSSFAILEVLKQLRPKGHVTMPWGLVRVQARHVEAVEAGGLGAFPWHGG